MTPLQEFIIRMVEDKGPIKREVHALDWTFVLDHSDDELLQRSQGLVS